jgi:hypothetical protein
MVGIFDPEELIVSDRLRRHCFQTEPNIKAEFAVRQNRRGYNRHLMGHGMRRVVMRDDVDAGVRRWSAGR